MYQKPKVKSLHRTSIGSRIKRIEYKNVSSLISANTAVPDTLGNPKSPSVPAQHGTHTDGKGNPSHGALTDGKWNATYTCHPHRRERESTRHV